MKRKIRIGLYLRTIGSFVRVACAQRNLKKGNVQGDELIARGWQKYLQTYDEVESVYLYGSDSVINEDLDVVIHFHPNLKLYEKGKNVFYIQNAFPKTSENPEGTLGVFKCFKEQFDGYIYPSQKLMEACSPGAVVPFATDPEFFYPQPSGLYEYPVSFVGNGIRSAAVNQRYFVPALPLGLTIYGNLWKYPLSLACRGFLPMPDLPKLYSDSRINLNAHVSEHQDWNTINLIIYDILACGGFILSDPVESLINTFGDAVVCTDGYEDAWAKIVYYLGNDEERRRRSQEGYKLVISNHSYAQRMQTVVDYLKEIL